MKSMHLLVVVALAFVAACNEPNAGIRSARTPIGEVLHTQRMLIPQRPPIIEAHFPEDLVVARVAAERAVEDELARRESSRYVGVDSLPLLTATQTGRRFLAARSPRALARGTPPEGCPAAAVASADTLGGAPTRAGVAIAALTECLRRIEPSMTGCGCRVVALDNMVTVPQSDVAYATGTSARLRSAALKKDLLLVAEEGDSGETFLRDLAGPVASVTRGEDHTVTVRLADSDRVFSGRSIPVGFRRGRLAERIYAEDSTGARLSLLIGFEPDELAQSAGAWLAWPSGG